LKAGDTIYGETVIHTSIGSSVVLKDSAGKTFTVGAARNGKAAELAQAGSSGVRVGGTTTRTDTGAVSRNTSNVSTASARASDQAGGDDIAAE
jgi:hypothetical protein